MKLRLTAAAGAVLAVGLIVGVSDSRTAARQATAASVRMIRLPPGGIQPHAAVDASGGVHVVYFVGDPGNGDLFYARVLPDRTFSPPIRVNSHPESAIATGTVRGARLAVGPKGRVHVAWNGSSRAVPKAPDGATPMLYSRSNDAGTAFEPQRNLVQHAVGLDGGGAVAADAAGRVVVTWHAGGPGVRDEGARRVWLTTSRDDGRTFGRERAVGPAETGACGCCGMDAGVDSRGRVLLLYRSARDVVHRDSYLLTANDAGDAFDATKLDSWEIGGCPMSTYDLTVAGDLAVAAWETAGQVKFARFSATRSGSLAPVAAPGTARNRRHPSIAVAPTGNVLMSWSEGTAWRKGGIAAWQMFDATGRPVGPPGRAEDVPVWGLTAAVHSPASGFVVLY